MACGAIMAAQPIWATTALSITVFLVAMAAVVWAVRGRSAPFCAGFALLGLFYLAIQFGPVNEELPSNLAPQRLVQWFSGKWMARAQALAFAKADAAADM